MKYDKRITNPITTIFTPFDTGCEVLGDCVGAEGYFSVNLEGFYNLDECDYGILKEVKHVADDEYEDAPYQACIEKKSEYEGIPCQGGTKCKMLDFYSYFLPAKHVKPVEEKKKKWRPFTLEEFRAKFPLLSPVTFRRKTNGGPKTLCFIGYNAASGVITLGADCYVFNTLFGAYELKDGDSWTPFGVEE